MNAADFVSGIKAEFEKVFPNGWISVGETKGLGGVNIGMTFGVVGNREELTSRILMNDPVFHNFLIHNEGDGKYEAAHLTGGISINPVEKYYAMSTVKTKWRKTTGDLDKIFKAYVRFFKRVKVLVEENEANIYGRDKYSDKWFK